MELSIFDILNILLRRIWILVLCTLLAFSGALVISLFLIAPKYTSTAQLYVNPNRDSFDTRGSLNELQYSQRLVNSYLIILKNNVFLENVSDQTNLGYSPGQIRGMLDLRSVDNTEIFEVKITSQTPQDAYNLVNTIVDLAPNEIMRIREGDSVRVVAPAAMPTSPSSPNVTLNSAIGALLGLALAIGVVILIDMLDMRIKTEEEFQERFGLPILGSIPKFDDTE